MNNLDEYFQLIYNVAILSLFWIKRQIPINAYLEIDATQVTHSLERANVWTVNGKLDLH